MSLIPTLAVLGKNFWRSHAPLQTDWLAELRDGLRAKVSHPAPAVRAEIRMAALNLLKSGFQSGFRGSGDIKDLVLVDSDTTSLNGVSLRFLRSIRDKEIGSTRSKSHQEVMGQFRDGMVKGLRGMAKDPDACMETRALKGVATYWPQFLKISPGHDSQACGEVVGQQLHDLAQLAIASGVPESIAWTRIHQWEIGAILFAQGWFGGVLERDSLQPREDQRCIRLLSHNHQSILLRSLDTNDPLYFKKATERAHQVYPRWRSLIASLEGSAHPQERVWAHRLTQHEGVLWSYVLKSDRFDVVEGLIRDIPDSSSSHILILLDRLMDDLDAMQDSPEKSAIGTILRENAHNIVYRMFREGYWDFVDDLRAEINRPDSVFTRHLKGSTPQSWQRYFGRGIMVP